MKTVLFTGLAVTSMLIASTGATANDSSNVGSHASVSDAMHLAANGRKGGGMPHAGMGMRKPGMPHMSGHRPNMPPIAHSPRPGMHGIPRTDVYRRPFRGFVVPRYWVQPTFFIGNYSTYGLSAPLRGYNWSRYYDDAVLTDDRGYVQDYRSDVNWNAGYSDKGDYHHQPDHGPSVRADAQAYDWGDNGKVVFAAPDGSSYSYDGEWQGEYVDPQGNVFEGEWEGTVTRHGDVAGPGHPAGPQHPPLAAAPYPGGPAYDESDDNYRVPQGYEGYEHCLKSNGLKGAAIGAIIGGVAGNRVAGRGDRLGGTLLGAGLGGLAGVAIEKATDKCKNYAPRSSHSQGYSQGYSQQSHGWQGGYYYYPQSPMVTVTVVPGGSHTTVTEETYYETVRAPVYRKIVRKWKPKPKPRCVCR